MQTYVRQRTMTASISSSENMSAGVFQKRSGSRWMSSATSRPVMSTWMRPEPEDDDCAFEDSDAAALSFSGLKWGPDSNTSWKWEKESTTLAGAAG